MVSFEFNLHLLKARKVHKGGLLAGETVLPLT